MASPPEDPVVAGVERELPGGFRRGLHGVGAQGDAPHPGALQAKGCVRLIGGARQDHGVLGGLGQGPGSAGGGLVGVADGAGQCLRDLVAGAEAGAEVVGQGEQGAPVLSGVKFVAVEAVFGAEADRRGGGVDGRRIAAVGAFVEGTAGAGTQQPLQGECGNVSDIADGVQAVPVEYGGCPGTNTGYFPDGAGPQDASIASGRVLDDGALG